MIESCQVAIGLNPGTPVNIKIAGQTKRLSSVNPQIWLWNGYGFGMLQGGRWKNGYENSFGYGMLWDVMGYDRHQ